MEEKKNEEQNVNTEEIKKETVETMNQVKETIKNVDIKNDAKAATGFIGSMFKDPFGTMKQIVNDNTNKHFKTAIIFVIVWMAVELIDSLFGGYYRYNRFSFNLALKQILTIIKAVVAPVLGIVVLSGTVYFMNKENKKSMITNITAIVTAKIPVIAASVVGLLTLISSQASQITVPFSAFCRVISIVLTYFATKTIFGEEQNSKFFKKFVLIEGIFYIAYFVISFLGIYIR